VLLKRSADGNTIDGGLDGAAQNGLVGNSSSGTFLPPVAIDGVVELAPLGRRDGWTSLPDVFGRRSAVSPRAA
jgi:hypothetical protein